MAEVASAVETCPECGGRGWVVAEDGGAGTARVCVCRDAGRVPRLLARAAIPERYRGKNFRNFNTRHGDSGEQDQRQNAKRVSEAYVEYFLSDEDEERGLVLVGEAGVGKTHLAVSIRGELIRRYRVDGLFVDFTELIHRIQSTFDPSSPESKHQVLDPVTDAEVLVLDELGAQKPTAWVREILYLVINARYTRRLPTIFTTNFSLGGASNGGGNGDPGRGAIALEERIGGPLVSRLHEMAYILSVSTQDFRRDARRNRAPAWLSGR